MIIPLKDAEKSAGRIARVSRDHSSQPERRKLRRIDVADSSYIVRCLGHDLSPGQDRTGGTIAIAREHARGSLLKNLAYERVFAGRVAADATGHRPPSGRRRAGTRRRRGAAWP